jgi:regulator of RNase E activity RraA
MTQQLDAPATLTLAERFERLDSPAIADAQRGMRVLPPRLRSLVPGRIIAGPAFTVRAYPGSLMSVMKALVEAPPGVILVVDADGDISAGAVWGEIVADEARQRGLKGIVVDGAARDCRGLRAVGFPTFAAGVNPRLGTNLQVGLTQVPISCCGVPVQPGDWIFADDDGAVVIAGNVLETILEAAEAVERRDREVAARVANGERLADVLGWQHLIYGDHASISVLNHPTG